MCVSLACMPSQRLAHAHIYCAKDFALLCLHVPLYMLPRSLHGLCCFQLFLETRLSSYPGLSHEKEEGLLCTILVSSQSYFAGWQSHYVLLPQLFVLPRPDDSAQYVKQAMYSYPTKTWDSFMHVQTVYTRPSPFSWEGLGCEASSLVINFCS